MKKLAIAAFCLYLIIAIVSSFQLERRLYNYQETQSYTIQQGETLFSIAVRSTDERYDPRRVVAILKTLNGGTSSIRAGQVIQIPIFGELAGSR